MLHLRPERVLLPSGFVAGAGVLIADGVIRAITRPEGPGPGAERLDLSGDLVPGFVDLQVNGGGGVLFNDQPSVEGVAAIARAHRRFGTTGLLPTLISDDPEVMAAAIRAVDEAIERGVPGVLGIHLEGPFLNLERKGIHDASRLRKLDAASIDLVSSLRRGRTLVTLAPELAPPGAIAGLVARGVIVAAGHTAASYEEARAAIGEGLTGFTHLFNAMSQLGSRSPGAVGAALDTADAWCGLIVDGRHVHPAALRVALAAKGAERMVLVTDAMPPVGADAHGFMLNGRPITVEDGRLTGADGTLAGSALDMAQSVRNAVAMLEVDRETALRMASAHPAAAIGLAGVTGSIRPGLRADLSLLDADGAVERTWIGGAEEAGW